MSRSPGAIALAVAALAVGALAVGALTVGALAVGALVTLASATVASGAVARAQDAPAAVAPERGSSLPAAFTVPWADAAPRLHARELRAAAVGLPDERVGRFDARRASARTRGRERALRMLHEYVDDALAAVNAPPREARAVHDAVSREARVVGARPLVDAGAVVVVAVPRAALSAACARGDVPWS